MINHMRNGPCRMPNRQCTKCQSWWFLIYTSVFRLYTLYSDVKYSVYDPSTVLRTSYSICFRSSFFGIWYLKVWSLLKGVLFPSTRWRKDLLAICCTPASSHPYVLISKMKNVTSNTWKIDNHSIIICQDFIKSAFVTCFLFVSPKSRFHCFNTACAAQVLEPFG